MSTIEIRAHCWGCGDPILEDEEIVVGDDNHDYHDECLLEEQELNGRFS